MNATLPSLRVGPGRVLLDPVDGSPLRFLHPDVPDQPFLLDESGDAWHTREHRWGSGFAITGDGSGRWLRPAAVELVDGERVTTRHEPAPGLQLTVERSGGAAFAERYVWTNTGPRRTVLRGLGISLPLRDVYDSARDALHRACHAHVFTGGAWSWVLAEPMNGAGPLLGLVVREGALWSYSIESRSAYGNDANARGHLIVQPTDAARNPGSFGGQPEFALEPGESWTLAWELAFHPDRASFLAATEAPVALPRLAAVRGEELPVRAGAGVRVSRPTAPDAGPARGGESQLEITHADGRRSRTAVLLHRPARDVVEQRIRFLLDRQRRPHFAAPDSFAFVPYDTGSGLTQPQAEWYDWTDGAERTGMPCLLQQARLRGWGGAAELDEALHGWGEFARARLVDVGSGVVHRGSLTVEKLPRLYNAPWLAHFFADQFRLYGAEEDLGLAARILERAFAADATGHLSIGLPEAAAAVAGLLDGAGEQERAAALRGRLLGLARDFARRGEDLPAHEVRYEQSMVAPLVSLLATARGLAADGAEEAVFDAALARAVPWLLAFGGPQPHVRQRHVGIRHWDGFWFGRLRLWGDTMPHYWSVLSAVALTQLPAAVRESAGARFGVDGGTAEGVFRANLVDFRDDGAASCAFVMPSCVGGVPAHRPDPLANDQDWALTLWLRHGAPERQLTETH